MRMRAVARLVGDDRGSIVKETHLELSVLYSEDFQKAELDSEGSIFELRRSLIVSRSNVP